MAAEEPETLNCIAVHRKKELPHRIHSGCRRAMRPLRLLLAVLPICLLFLVYPGLALTEGTQLPSGVVCPPQQKIIDELANMYIVLQNVQMELDELLSGREIAGTSLDALLVVDLMDDAAVARRRKELQALVRPSHVVPVSELDPVIQCALSDKQLHETAQQLMTFEKQVDALRLQFLQLPKEQIGKILSIQMATDHAVSGFEKKIAEERTLTIKNLAEANAQLKTAQFSLLNAPSVDQKNMVQLDKTKVDILNTKMQWLSEIGSRQKFYRDTVLRLLAIKGLSLKTALSDAIKDDLSQTENKAIQSKRLEDIQKDYQDVVNLWRILVDEAYEKSYASIYELKLPELKPFAGAIRERTGEHPQTKTYQDTYNETVQIKDLFWRLNTETFNLENDTIHRLLLATGQLRADLLDKLLEMEDYAPLSFSNEHFQDLFRELKIVPYRWSALFSIKILDMRHDLEMGIAGIFKLINDIFHFILFICFFILFWLGVKKTLTALDRLQGSIIKGQSKNKTAIQLALWIQRLIPYMPWLVILPAVDIGRMLIEKSVFSEFIIVLPYIKIYSVYRILMHIVIDLFTYITQQAEVTQFETVQRKILRSTRILGLFFFVSWSLLYAVESIVSQALAYRLVMKAFILIGTILSAWVANSLRKEMAEFIEDFAAFSLSRRVAKGCRGKFTLLWSLPALMLATLITVFRLGEKWGERFELYKKISAKIFKHKLRDQNIPGQRGSQKGSDQALRLLVHTG